MFEKVLVKNPKRAKFDFSHGNTLSMQFGYLTPTEVRFIVPGDDVSVSMEQIVRCAPMPVPTFVNMKIRHDWFFVPLSMMYNQQAIDLLFGQQQSNYHRAAFETLYDYVGVITDFTAGYGQPGVQEPFVPGSLHDYFNLPVFDDVKCSDNSGNTFSEFTSFMSTPSASAYSALVNNTNIKTHLQSMPGPVVEPHLAYHYIWRDWYRYTGFGDATEIGASDVYLENHVFNTYLLGSYLSNSNTPGAMGIVSQVQRHGPDNWFSYLGVPYHAYQLKDMFTSARYGTKPQVLIPTGGSGTIPNLRTASSLQKFIDIISVAGMRYWDKVKALWNETPAGMKCERAQFLGRYMAFIKVGEVITTATTSQAETGDYSGRGMLVDGRYIFKRHFNEHGWLMCISSIVPEAAYAGYDRQFTDQNILDTPVPSFANIGDQSILVREVRVKYSNGFVNNNSWGDQFRYYAYKSDVNRVHGDFLMRSFQPWTAIPSSDQYLTTNPRMFAQVTPFIWNKIFNVTTPNAQPFFNGRFYVDLTFHEFITRSLPKYVSYAL